MASNWNLLMDGLARTGLGEHEQRVVAAVARKTLGYRKTSDRIPISQIVELTGIEDRRHVSRALDQLARRNIITRSGGSVGRGNAAVIALNVNVATWAVNVPPEATKKKRPVRHKTSGLNVPPEATVNVPPEAHSIGSRGKEGGAKRLATASTTVDKAALLRRAFEVHSGAGGSTNDRERATLAAQVRQLAKSGIDEKTILAAVKSIGRNREFPGLLKERVSEITAAGGPCDNHGRDRKALPFDELSRCACSRCSEWVNARVAA